jgi:hypothetical protein
MRETTCYPYAVCVFEDAAMQPYIHNCTIQVQEGNNIYCFAEFFKWHCHLKLNHSMPVERDGVKQPEFHGDILVMRLGAMALETFINMRECDTLLADWVINR